MGKKREHDPKKWRTAGDIKETAELRGAQVIRKGLWHKIITALGCMQITSDDNQELDKHTLANARRWFRLLGLMSLIGFLLWYFWPALKHFGII